MTSASPDAADIVLGVSCDYHDAAAALIIEGRIVAAAEEERFTRRKHDDSVPSNAIAACLDIAGITAAEVGSAVFYEKPLGVVGRYFTSRQQLGPAGLRSFVEDVPTLLRRNLWVGYRIRRVLRDLGAKRPPTIDFIEHHRSHAAAAFYPSPFTHAAVLTVDGIGEWATTTISHGAGHRLTLLEELRYPNSLGLVYSLVTRWCGFRPNDGESKLMGLAPYGEPAYADALSELVTVNDDGSVKVEAARLGWFSGGRAARHLARLLDGPPRAEGTDLTQREADLAASVQQLTETALLAMAVRARELTEEPDLCLAGGVALNCVANGRLASDGPFDSIWIQPAAGDTGSAIGAALALWHDVRGAPRVDHSPAPDGMSGALLGPAIDAEHIARSLTDAAIEFTEYEPERIDELVSARLADGAIVGWYQGRMEFGPRALGNRSILADPRNALVREVLNASVKGRESFRPFAPAVLAAHAAEWFDLPAPSPYMLIVGRVREEHLVGVTAEPTTIEERSLVPRSTIPACTHIDGSARVQTVSPASNPRFHSLLEAFHRLTGCPVLLNTSFNVADEPIVATVVDAVSTARRSGLDLLVIGGAVIEGDALRGEHQRADVLDGAT